MVSTFWSSSMLDGDLKIRYGVVQDTLPKGGFRQLYYPSGASGLQVSRFVGKRCSWLGHEPRKLVQLAAHASLACRTLLATAGTSRIHIVTRLAVITFSSSWRLGTPWMQRSGSLQIMSHSWQPHTGQGCQSLPVMHTNIMWKTSGQPALEPQKAPPGVSMSLTSLVSSVWTWQASVAASLRCIEAWKLRDVTGRLMFDCKISRPILKVEK